MKGFFPRELPIMPRAICAPGGLVALIRIHVQAQPIAGATQNTRMMIEENLEQAKVHQQRVASVSPMAEAEVPATGLVELVDVAQADQIVAARPGIQRLKLLVFERGHPGLGLENVAPDQGIRSPSPGMGHRVGQGLDPVRNDEPLLFHDGEDQLRSHGPSFCTDSRCYCILVARRSLLELGEASGSQSSLIAAVRWDRVDSALPIVRDSGLIAAPYLSTLPESRENPLDGLLQRDPGIFNPREGLLTNR